MHISVWHAVALVTATTCILLGPAASVFIPDLDATSVEAGYEDIPPSDAYELLTDASSVQIPIDVRTDGEWRSERIDTPYPEFPRHFALSRLDSEQGMQTFKARYAGATVIVYCKSGGRSSTATQLLDAAGFDGAIYNLQGGITAWKEEGYPTKTGNTAPESPAALQGPAEVHAGDAATYTASAVDPDGDPVRYGWGWDSDGAVDSWTDYSPSGMQANASHAWTAPGIYQVQVVAKDHVGDRSDWTSKEVIVDNAAPEPPSIAGPSSGRTGQSYRYNFTVSDPDGDRVYLWVEWSQSCPAEEWLGPFSSGETVTLEHIWNESGIYTVKAKAKDTVDGQSDWETMQVSMPLCHPCDAAFNMWRYLSAWLAELTGLDLRLLL